MSDKDCIFCKIVAGEIPAKFEHQSESVLVFPDINPQAPVHLLIIPKKHVVGFADIAPGEKEIWDEMVGVAHQLIDRYNLREKGYRLSINGGPAALVQHLHMHLLGEIEAERKV